MIPIILSTPEKMRLVRVITVKDYTYRTLEFLQKMGVIHVQKASELDPIDKAALEKTRLTIRQVLTNIHDILSLVRGERDVTVLSSRRVPSISEIADSTSRIRDKCLSLREGAFALDTEIAALEQLGKHIEILLNKIDLPLRDLKYSGSYVFTTFFSMPCENLDIFMERAEAGIIQQTVAYGAAEAVIFIIARTHERRAIEDTARNLGAVFFDIPIEDTPMSEFIAQKNTLISEKSAKAAILREELEHVLNKYLPELVFARQIANQESERLSVIELACEAHYVNLIEGWIPESAANRLTSSIKSHLPDTFVDTRTPEATESPPTKFVNLPVIRPFQVIVSLFSLPRYGDWDPSPIVAYFFAFFFGLMLNDVVYAVGLIITAHLFLSRLVDDPTADNFFLFRKVLYISGITSLVMGLLSGTYMGDFLNMYFNVDLNTIALAGAVQRLLADPVSFIVFSLILGLIHVNMAHILALVRGAREKNRGLVAGKIGLFLTEIFGIPYLFSTLLHIDLLPIDPDIYSFFIYPLSLGLILIVASGFMQMGGLGGVFWIFELTGILGDVMSYSRLAGVGLATYYLASSFNLLAQWISSMVSGVIPGIVGHGIAFAVALLMLLIMHVFNMLLSSLAAFIHSLRLCFVEFLLKFYEGGGLKYSPYRLSVRKHVVVGSKL